jgi:predicted nucleic acid-binding protein
VLEWREMASPWYLTWGIIYEFLRVATHRNVFRKPFPLSQAWNFIETILASSSVSILVETERHDRVASEVFGSISGIAGNLVFDAHTAILMKEHGVKKLYTHDSDFHRFPFLEILDPIQGIRGTGRGKQPNER